MNEATKTAAGAPQRRIDWQEIHRRLDLARAALERGITPTLEGKKHILKARAHALARAPEEERNDQEQVEVVEFLLAYERYAVESSFVREVCPLKELTFLPSAPAFLAGVMNVRGQIVSVVDLKKFFDLPEKGLTDLNKVIIISNGQMEFGVLADVVFTVRHVPLSELQRSLPTLTGVRAEYLKGVTANRLIVLEAAKLLADPQINIYDTVDI